MDKKKLKIIIPVILVVVVAALLLINKNPADKDIGSAKIPATDNIEPSPSRVVQAYMNATLGTLPSTSLNYEIAKEFLTENLRAQFTDDSFVPKSYGIQQGPDEIKIKSENIDGNSAIVAVQAFYGKEIGVLWNFTLELEDGLLWKIAEIENKAP